jgi:uncharacterized membrane protein YjgN (DUF898 family)
LPLPVSFSGKRGEFFRLARNGAALEFVTFGFYRFWLATDIRRHLWSHTSVNGDAPEYTGRARELLIGFLFALAILVPIYVAYFLLSVEAERDQQLSSSPLFVLFYMFGQFAIYRARRYRLSRTVWRGVRFWMDGSGVAYAFLSMLWGVAVLFTLGLALPWREAALERYKMKHSYYGDLQGSFEGRGSEFFKQGWWLWLLVPVAYLFSPVAPFIYAAFKAVEWRWWISGVRFGDVRLVSRLRKSDLIDLYWKVIGWGLLLGLAYIAYLAVAVVVLVHLSGESFEQFFKAQAILKNVPLWVLAGIGYLVLVLSINVTIRVYLLRDLWARVVGSTTVHNIEAAMNVTARGELAGALGEGLADGLDVAGF